MFREQAREQGSGWLIPPPSPENWGVTAADDLRWLRAKLRPHPIKTFEQPLLHHVPPADDGPIRTFIWCTEYLTHARVAERIQADNTWRYRELVTGHDAMVTAPAVLSRLLLELG